MPAALLSGSSRESNPPPPLFGSTKPFSQRSPRGTIGRDSLSISYRRGIGLLLHGAVEVAGVLVAIDRESCVEVAARGAPAALGGARSEALSGSLSIFPTQQLKAPCCGDCLGSIPDVQLPVNVG